MAFYLSNSFLRRNALYVALFAAWFAACGSLYMSEVMGWIPCQWCWYQRILMYPAALVLGLGLVLRERNLPYYALLLGVPGLAASTYHILLQKVPSIAALHPCTQGVPCSGDYLYQLGVFPEWMTIPMLAWLAFAVIIVAALLALPTRETQMLRAEKKDEPKPLLPTPFLVGLIVIPVVVLFGLSGYLRNRQKAVDVLNTLPFLAASTSEAIYRQACAGCHATNASLMRKEFLQKDNLSLLSFMRKGRTALESELGSGNAMPPSGGRPDLTDAQLIDVIKYARTLKN